MCPARPAPGVAGHSWRRRSPGRDDAGARTPSRLGLGVAVVLIGVIIVRFDPSPEHRLVSIVSPPPNGISWLVNVVAVLGTYGMLAALVVLAFISGRRALARDVLVGRPGRVRTLSRPVGNLRVQDGGPAPRHGPSWASTSTTRCPP